MASEDDDHQERRERFAICVRVWVILCLGAGVSPKREISATKTVASYQNSSLHTISTPSLNTDRGSDRWNDQLRLLKIHVLCSFIQ